MVWNLPNILTLSRILLIPIIIFFDSKGHLLTALFLMVFAALTDFLDGYIARKLNQCTHIGEILDPIADRVYAISFYTYLTFNDLIPWWFASIVIFRNFSQFMALPILVWWLKRTFYVKPKLFAKWGTVVSDVFLFFPMFLFMFIPWYGIVEKILFTTVLLMEIPILITYLPRLVAIAMGKHDTFE